MLYKTLVYKSLFHRCEFCVLFFLSLCVALWCVCIFEVCESVCEGQDESGLRSKWLGHSSVLSAGTGNIAISPGSGSTQPGISSTCLEYSWASHVFLVCTGSLLGSGNCNSPAASFLCLTYDSRAVYSSYSHLIKTRVRRIKHECPAALAALSCWNTEQHFP